MATEWNMRKIIVEPVIDPTAAKRVDPLVRKVYRGILLYNYLSNLPACILRQFGEELKQSG